MKTEGLCHQIAVTSFKVKIFPEGVEDLENFVIKTVPR